MLFLPDPPIMEEHPKMTTENLYSVTLKCGTAFDYKDLENANLSFVPCGITKEGEEKPLLKFGSLWNKRVPVKRESYGKRWNYTSMQEFTGYQLMTGKPSYRRNGETDYIYYVSLDIERSLIDRFPEQTEKIKEIYNDNLTGKPCIIKTKSDGSRLDAFTEYCGKQMSFKDGDDEMLFEILADKCLTRLDNRYTILEGSIFNMPTLPKSALQEIYYVINEVAAKEETAEQERQVVEKSQIGDLALEWDTKGRSQLFPTQYCQITTHKSNRDEVRFSKNRGGIDGKCFNCGGTWWEVEPKSKPKPKSNSQSEPKRKLTKSDFNPYFLGNTFIPPYLADELMNEKSLLVYTRDPTCI